MQSQHSPRRQHSPHQTPQPRAPAERSLTGVSQTTGRHCRGPGCHEDQGDQAQVHPPAALLEAAYNQQCDQSHVRQKEGSQCRAPVWGQAAHEARENGDDQCLNQHISPRSPVEGECEKEECGNRSAQQSHNDIQNRDQ